MPAITQDFLYKEAVKGTSKRNGNDYHMIVLHDEKTLDNVTFFVGDDTSIDTTPFKLKDSVTASFEMAIRGGKMVPVLIKVVKSVKS